MSNFSSHLLTNARIVTADADFTGTVVVEEGIITAIHKDKVYRDGIDLRGQWLTPGCIDIHTDYLEKELHPRSSASFPLSFALHFMDARAASCGITTVFSAISYSDNENKSRSLEQAVSLARDIDAARQGLLVRHYVHARIDPNTNAILDVLEGMRALESLYLVVFNDTIPGQRQFTIEQQVEMRMQSRGWTREEALESLRRQAEKAGAIDHRQLIRAAFEGKCILGSHDDTTEAHVREAAAAGAVLSEMPTTLAAARIAGQLGLWICMGAPNYYRGGSHCGNLSCIEAMEEDLVDILCSDYHFPAMLGSVVRMMEDGTEPCKAVNMVSWNPAKLLGLNEQLGCIGVGKKADLIAWNAAEGYAAVTGVWVDGRCKLSANYSECLSADYATPDRGRSADGGLGKESYL
jgi:alpha-D-ribose 1-methylphosphonate 5-triphosphate diphosphatase